MNRLHPYLGRRRRGGSLGHDRSSSHARSLEHRLSGSHFSLRVSLPFSSQQRLNKPGLTGSSMSVGPHLDCTHHPLSGRRRAAPLVDPGTLTIPVIPVTSHWYLRHQSADPFTAPNAP